MNLTSPAASELQTDYMKLLLAQMQNQNPLEPLSNNEMASQLAQFSQLQQLESMNSNFAEVLSATTRGYANSLIGKKVSYYLHDALTGAFEKRTDTVDEIYKMDGDEPLLMIGRRNVDLADIVESLLGEQVTFFVETSSGQRQIKRDTIQSFYQKDGKTFLVTSEYTLGLEDTGNSLIGKEVSYFVETDWGTREKRYGIVEDIRQEVGKDVLVVSQPLSLEEVVSVGR